MFGPRNHTPRIGSPATESVACLAVTAGLTGCSTPEAADAEAAATVRAGDGASASAGTENVTKRGHAPAPTLSKTAAETPRQDRAAAAPSNGASSTDPGAAADGVPEGLRAKLLTCARPAPDLRPTSVRPAFDQRLNGVPP